MKHAATQSDMNMNFDGMESMKPSRSSKYMTNAWSGHMNDGRLVNKGRGPTVGNTGCDTGPNCPPTSAVPRLPAQGSVRDSINRGSQVRGSGMTAVKHPANPDSIRVGQSGGTAYGAVTKSSRPATQAGKTTFNNGPKSQY